jgi:hypothetical protein
VRLEAVEGFEAWVRVRAGEGEFEVDALAILDFGLRISDWKHIEAVFG